MQRVAIAIFPGYLSPRPLLTSSHCQPSITEEEDQIHPGALDAALADTIGGPGSLGRCRPHQPQEVTHLVLEQELAVGAVAELLAQLEERPVTDLLADGDAGAECLALAGGRDLEEIEVERAADGFAEWGRDEAAGNATGGRRERRTFASPELVDRPVEDDQGEDVGFLERRRARQ